MLTVALAVLTTGLAVAVGVFYSLWREASQIAAGQARLIRHQCERINGYRAELDALSIAGPPVDTVNGSHDRLPIREDIRHTLTAYIEGMWHQPAKDHK